MLELGLEVTLCMKKCRYFEVNEKIVIPAILIPVDTYKDIRISGRGLETYTDSGSGAYDRVEDLVRDGWIDPDDKHLIEAVRHLLLWVRGE